MEHKRRTSFVTQINNLIIILNPNDTVWQHLIDKISCVARLGALNPLPNVSRSKRLLIYFSTAAVLCIGVFLSNIVFVSLLLHLLILWVFILLFFGCNYVVFIQTIHHFDVYYKSFNLCIALLSIEYMINFGFETTFNENNTMVYKHFCAIETGLMITNNLILILLISMIDGYNWNKWVKILAITMLVFYYLFIFFNVISQFRFQISKKNRHNIKDNTSIILFSHSFRSLYSIAISAMLNTIVFLLKQFYYIIKKPNKLALLPIFLKFKHTNSLRDDGNIDNLSRYDYSCNGIKTPTIVSVVPSVTIASTISLPSTIPPTVGTNLMAPTPTITMTQLKTPLQLSAGQTQSMIYNDIASIYVNRHTSTNVSILRLPTAMVPSPSITSITPSVNFENDHGTCTIDDSNSNNDNNYNIEFSNNMNCTNCNDLEQLQLSMNENDTLLLHLLVKIVKLNIITAVNIVDLLNGKTTWIVSLIYFIFYFVLVFVIFNNNIYGSLQIYLQILQLLVIIPMFLNVNVCVFNWFCQRSFSFWWKLLNTIILLLLEFIFDYVNKLDKFDSNSKYTSISQAYCISIFNSIISIVAIGGISMIRGFFKINNLLKYICIILIIMYWAYAGVKVFVINTNDELNYIHFGIFIVNIKTTIMARVVDTIVWFIVQLFNQIKFSNGLIVTAVVKKKWINGDESKSVVSGKNNIIGKKNDHNIKNSTNVELQTHLLSGVRV